MDGLFLLCDCNELYHFFEAGSSLSSHFSAISYPLRLVSNVIKSEFLSNMAAPIQELGVLDERSQVVYQVCSGDQQTVERLKQLAVFAMCLWEDSYFQYN